MKTIFSDIYDSNHMGILDVDGSPRFTLAQIVSSGCLRGVKWWSPGGRPLTKDEDDAINARIFAEIVAEGGSNGLNEALTWRSALNEYRRDRLKKKP